MCVQRIDRKTIVDYSMKNNFSKKLVKSQLFEYFFTIKIIIHLFLYKTLYTLTIV
jgi:hypothetical protein